MSAAKHTPGPWYFDSNYGMVRQEASDATIARAFEDDGHLNPRARKDLPQEANARLIAAAPDLLEALRAVTEVLDFAIGADLVPPGADGPAALARAAISKAEGRA